MIESIINSKKIKYIDLQNTFIPKLPQNTDYVRMFINLDNIINDIQNNKDAIDELESDNFLILSSELANLIAHYRKFFYSRYGMKSVFIFYYSTNILNNFNKTVKARMLKNLKLLSILIDYIPDVSIVDMQIDQSETVPYYIITNEEDKESLCMNLILTGRKTDFQLVNLPNTAILYSVRGNHKLIQQDNVYSVLVKDKNSFYSNVTRNLISLIIALNGDKIRNVEGIPKYSYKSIMNRLNILIQQNKISNTYHNIDDIEKILNEFSIADKTIYILIKSYFAKIDVRYSINNLSQFEINKIVTRNKFIEDMNTLKEVNRKYYEYNPLQLIEMLEGY